MRKLLYILIFLLCLPGVAQADSLYSLEITNIKPAGTGDPSIPDTNRIFKAYPGIEYNIRAAVKGGEYPYTYSLSGEPSGMSIDSETGEITWTDPQSDTGTITLTVEDNTGTTTSADWSIDVETDGFLFVDSSASSGGDGTKNNPYNSIQSLIDDTDSTDVDKFVYFREGEYSLPEHGTWDTFEDRYGYQAFDLFPEDNNRPLNWMGYPGEDVFVDCNYRSIRAYVNFYIDNMNFGRIRDYFLITSGGSTEYATIRRSHFWDLSSISDTDHNFGYLFTSESTTAGHYLVIQDNVFSHWQSNQISSGIGSLYTAHDAIIEDNYIHTPGKTRYTNLGISPKTDCDGITIRGNKVITKDGAPLGQNNSYFYATDAEVNFNIFHRTDSTRWLHKWNQVASEPQEDLLYWRNTAIGDDTGYLYTPEDPDGPFTYRNNVVCVTNNGMDLSDNPRVTYEDNLDGTESDADSMLNEDYTLSDAYDEYRGTHGYEISGRTKEWPDPVRKLPIAFSDNGYAFVIYDPNESPSDDPEVYGETDDEECTYEDGEYCYELRMHGEAYPNAYADGTSAELSEVEVKHERGNYSTAVDTSDNDDWSTWESAEKIKICEGANRIYFQTTDVDGNTSESFREITVTSNAEEPSETITVPVISTGTGKITAGSGSSKME